jgi:hypothetical protein
MVRIVVGGQSRNIGKTTVAAGLISALRERAWTAVKITVCKESECPVNGFGCRCPAREHLFSIVEEKDPVARSDSSRFLAAGAKESFWARVKPGAFNVLVPPLGVLLERAEHVILESNSVMRYLRPDLYIMVLDPAVEDWKSSALELLPLADAVVKIIKIPDPSGGRGREGKLPGLVPIFIAEEAAAAMPALLQFVRERLEQGSEGERITV